MFFCAHCGQELHLEGRIGREEVCPRCGGYLHCCLNCRFFKGQATGRCLEPQAEEVRDRQRANFCDFFAFAEDRPGQASSEASAQARARFHSLFSPRPTLGDPEPGKEGEKRGNMG